MNEGDGEGRRHREIQSQRADIFMALRFTCRIKETYTDRARLTRNEALPVITLDYLERHCKFFPFQYPPPRLQHNGHLRGICSHASA